MYLIIGWNEIVESLSKSFEYRGYDFKIFVPEESMNSVKRETKNNEKISEKIFRIDKLHDFIERDSKIFLLQSDINEKKDVLKTIKDYSEDCHIISTACGDEMESLKGYPIDSIIREDILLSGSLIKSIDDMESKSNSQNMVEIIKGSEKEIAIFLHDNPDPDAFASAMALETICEKYDKTFNTYYGGDIGHPENEIIIENTGIKMKNIEKEDIDTVLEISDVIVFLDFAKPGVNSILPKKVNADIILDHHHTNRDVKQAGHVEVRSDVGATSTIITKHLLNLNIQISPMLASSLLYGIKVDTDDFKKNIFPMDFKIISFLSAIADKELIDIFESQPMDPDTMSALGRAISNRRFKNESLIAFAGRVSKKDDIPQLANILSRERDINTVLIYGILDDNIYMSARTKALNIHIGKKMKKAYSSLGEAGGHPHSAGGKIKLSKFNDEKDAIKRIERIFIKEVVKDQT
ncbi:MAG: bifunctional oligoribonuclease/PAP phosphatase NrnA [Candidatus Saliniplasma sp.]